ncbi:MAG TPA: EutN/CcmL family microcompartment protein [Gemmatimonadaceae bacterium]|nr:EutN/CcmL family microcompartment protein [Gemmatimonadaceae bacterium]
MHLARIIGRVVATIKQETLSGVTLQWIQPVDAAGASTGKPIIAADRLGTGPGEVVYYVTAREASLTLDRPFAAVDAGIVGRVDWVNVDGRQALGEGR